MPGTGNRSSLSAAARDEKEMRLTFERIAGLELFPVAGAFDVLHLKEIHRRIFHTSGVRSGDPTILSKGIVVKC